MTVLKKAVRRELPITFDRRQWVVEITPWGLEFRAKRTRTAYSITWDSVLVRTMEIAASHARAEKARKRMERRT